MKWALLMRETDTIDFDSDAQKPLQKAPTAVRSLARGNMIFISYKNGIVKRQLHFLTTQIGLEPTTFAVTGRRSNQLSHWAILCNEWTFGDSNPGPTGYEPVALTN